MLSIACWKVPTLEGWEALAAWPGHPRGIKKPTMLRTLDKAWGVSSLLGRVRPSSGA